MPWNPRLDLVAAQQDCSCATLAARRRLEAIQEQAFETHQAARSEIFSEIDDVRRLIGRYAPIAKCHVIDEISLRYIDTN